MSVTSDLASYFQRQLMTYAMFQGRVEGLTRLIDAGLVDGSNNIAKKLGEYHLELVNDLQKLSDEWDATHLKREA